MTNYERLINTLINEVLAKIDSTPCKTLEEFYQTLSEDAKSGYDAVVDYVCSGEGLERAEKYISTDEVIEAIADYDKTDINSLLEYIEKKVLDNMEWAADREEYERYEYECERADRAYDEWRDRVYVG